MNHTNVAISDHYTKSNMAVIQKRDQQFRDAELPLAARRPPQYHTYGLRSAVRVLVDH